MQIVDHISMLNVKRIIMEIIVSLSSLDLYNYVDG